MHPASAAHEKRKKESPVATLFFSGGGGPRGVSEHLHTHIQPCYTMGTEGGGASSPFFPYIHQKKPPRERKGGGEKQSRNYHGCLSRAASFGKERTSADFPASSEENT